MSVDDDGLSQARALVARLVEEEDPAARSSASDALARLGPAVCEEVRPLLNDPRPSARRHGAELAGRLGDSPAAPRLMTLLEDPDPNVQAAAAEALGALGWAPAEAALLGVLRAGAPWAAAAALSALAALQRPPPIAELERALEEPQLAAAAYRALGASGAPSALRLLLEGIASTRAGQRAAALEALGRRMAREGAGEVWVAEVRRLAAASPVLLRAAARQALGAAGVEARSAGLLLCGALGAPALAFEIACASEGGCAVQAARALRTLGAGCAPGLLARMEELAAGPRAVALEVLGDWAEPSWRPRLSVWLTSTEPELREFAARCLRRPEIGAGELEPGSERPPLGDEEFEALRAWVSERSGIWLREELRFVLERRLWPRVQALGIDGFGPFLDRLAAGASASEAEAVLDLVATHETYFFRDPLQLEAFSKELLPEVVAQNASSRSLRLWSAGCSTGEEAYTLAILLLEAPVLSGWELAVCGTDLSARVVEHARWGEYAQSSTRQVPSRLLERHFDRGGERVRVRERVRERVRFSHGNLVDPESVADLPPMDVVFCRNVLLYLGPEARRRALSVLWDKLRPGGYLVLGHAENLLSLDTGFEPIPLQGDLVYRRPLEAG